MEDNVMIVERPEVIGDTIRYHYHVVGPWKKYFRNGRKGEMYVTYGMNMEAVPEGILLIPFLSCVLPLAWIMQSTVRVDTVDAMFYESMRDIRETMQFMYPMIPFGGAFSLKVASLDYAPSKPLRDARQNQDKIPTQGALALYSGGVDSVYTILSHRCETPDLLFIGGADIPMKKQARNANGTFAARDQDRSRQESLTDQDRPSKESLPVQGRSAQESLPNQDRSRQENLPDQAEGSAACAPTTPFQTLREQAEAFARDLLLPLHTAKTNFRTFLREDLLDQLVMSYCGDGWWHGFQHGLALAGIAAPLADLLGKRRVYIASSFSEEDGRIPLGSDPMLEGQMAFAGTRIIHDGYTTSRMAKVRFIALWCELSQKRLDLHVCWESQDGTNCCKCEKCFRTMSELLLAGEDPAAYGFYNAPPEPSLSCLKKLMEEMKQKNVQMYYTEMKGIYLDQARECRRALKGEKTDRKDEKRKKREEKVEAIGRRLTRIIPFPDKRKGGGIAK